MKSLPAFIPALLVSCVCPAADNPYGTCAHVARDEFRNHGRIFEMLSGAGIGWLRTDFDWLAFERVPDDWRFDKFDILFDDAEKKGLQLLPLLGGFYLQRFSPAHEHLDEWSEYIRRALTPYKGRLSAVEVWNEPNLAPFWNNPNPADYAKLLKRTYAEVKKIDPAIRVVVSGFSGVPIPFIRGVYEAGGAGCFDVMNVHPYSWPSPPEGALDVNLDKLRALMEEFGDGGKPIWITEIGWPNHTGRLAAPGLLRAGLNAVYAESRPLAALYCDIAPDGGQMNPKLKDVILSEFPDNSTLDYCSGATLATMLASKSYDVVVNPLSLERCLVETLAPLWDFVAGGGTLVQFGGSTWYYPMKIDGDGAVVPTTADMESWRRRFRICRASRSTCTNIPARVRVLPTRAALNGIGNAGDAYWADRFFSSDYLQEGDEFIPLLTGESLDGDKNGAVAACVCRFNNDMNGAVILSGLFEVKIPGDDEHTQASKLTRSLGIAFAKKVERFFNYEFMAPEKDVEDPESHFGMVHPDFSPKLAFLAYSTFVAMRPSGSGNDSLEVGKGGEWRVSWRRPDGVPAGMVWLPRARSARRTLTFSGDGATLKSFLGDELPAHPVGDRAVEVLLGEDPVYWSGADLVELLSSHESLP